MITKLPMGFIRTTIERRLDDLAGFWLRPEDPMTFVPGQYDTLVYGHMSGRSPRLLGPVALRSVSPPDDPAA